MNFMAATIIDRIFTVGIALMLCYFIIRSVYKAVLARQVFLFFDGTRRVCMRCGAVHRREHWIIPYWEVEKEGDGECECNIFAIKGDNS